MQVSAVRTDSNVRRRASLLQVFVDRLLAALPPKTTMLATGNRTMMLTARYLVIHTVPALSRSDGERARRMLCVPTPGKPTDHVVGDRGHLFFRR